MLREFPFIRNIASIAVSGIKTVRGISYDPFEFSFEMPKSKEYLSSDDSDSSIEKAPKRKREREDKKKEEKKSYDRADKEKAASSKKQKSSSNDEEASNWELGNNRRVSISEFKGKLLIDIREMYLDSNGDAKPGKKGISLTMPQWRKFMEYVEEIDKAAKKKC